MIFYFSGNGNSRHVARSLGSQLNEPVASVFDRMSIEEMAEGRFFAVVCPVYAWGIPEPVADFIKGLPETFVARLRSSRKSVWCVLTCGDDTGMAPERLKTMLRKRGLETMAVFSVQMPNTYVILPGFDVDSQETAKEKIKASVGRIEKITRSIEEGKVTVDVVRGSWPRVKSALYPLKGIWTCHASKWHHTEECTGCGVCSRVCPKGNVAMQSKGGEQRPEWGTDCCSCLACYHHCPSHAVAYGNATEKKGQYYFGIFPHIQ